MEHAVYEEVERRMKSRDAQAKISEFQNRDAAFLREKQMIEKFRKEEAEKRQKRLEQTKEPVAVESDPTRLYQPTKSWRTRATTPRSAEGPRSTRDAPIINPVLVTHLAVPSWRQGI